MPELGPYGSVRGARGNSRPYRESSRPTAKVTRLTHTAWTRSRSGGAGALPYAKHRSNMNVINISAKKSEP
jgi:hypothetical protein